MKPFVDWKSLSFMCVCVCFMCWNKYFGPVEPCCDACYATKTEVFFSWELLNCQGNLRC